MTHAGRCRLEVEKAVKLVARWLWQLTQDGLLTSGVEIFPCFEGIRNLEEMSLVVPEYTPTLRGQCKFHALICITRVFRVGCLGRDVGYIHMLVNDTPEMAFCPAGTHVALPARRCPSSVGHPCLKITTSHQRSRGAGASVIRFLTTASTHLEMFKRHDAS